MDIIDPTTTKTKWDYISEEHREALRRIPFGSDCGACGEMLETEADFAQHFILVYGPRYLNLGDCPRNPKR